MVTLLRKKEEFYIQIGRDKGQVEFGSNYALHLETEEILSKDFEWKNNGDSLELAIPFKDFGKYAGSFKVGQTISIAAFQEGEANGWAIDWTESAEHEIGQAYLAWIPWHKANYRNQGDGGNIAEGVAEL